MKRQDRLDFRSEHQIAFVQSIMQRLLAHAIARQQQKLLTLIVQSNGEHAAQFLNTLGPDFLVQVNYDFSVGVGIETVAAILKLPPEVRKVIDFSIENDPDAAIFVVNRLPTGTEVNDAQTQIGRASCRE